MTLIRRIVTSSPLARRRERDPALARAKRIPLERFRRDRYHPSAVAIAGEAMSALAKGEYLAVDLFAKLAAALTVAGAPFDVIAAATRAQADELGHAELAIATASMLVERDLSFSIDPAQHASLAGPLSLAALDRAMAHLPAIGETLACAMIGTAADLATDPIMKAVFSGLLRDEVSHARLGWYYLAWRAEAWSVEERQRLADEVGAFVMDIEVMFSRGRDAPRGAKSDARALGVLDTKTQRALVRRAMEEEIVPGLDGLGLGASHAWRARRRS